MISMGPGAINRKAFQDSEVKKTEFGWLVAAIHALIYAKKKKKGVKKHDETVYILLHLHA